MIQKDLQVLLKKAEELKALFVLGQRVIPMLEEIFVFVSEIQPLLDDINSSIEENLKKMPSASKQLSKVTEATEKSTNEIMDIVDGLVYKSDLIKSNLQSIREDNKNKISGMREILEIIQKAINQNNDPKDVLPDISRAIAKLKTSEKGEVNVIVDNSVEILDTIQMDSSSIMMSLQVQDITSQQIAAVNHLLETVQEKLKGILSKYQSSELNEIVTDDGIDAERMNISKLHRQIAFDPDAVEALAEKDFRQQNVDEVVKQQMENPDLEDPEEFENKDEKEGPKAAEPDNISENQDSDIELTEPASQEDIDSLFEQNNTEEKEKSTEDNNEDVVDDFEQFSQDDIDALFGN